MTASWPSDERPTLLSSEVESAATASHSGPAQVEPDSTTCRYRIGPQIGRGGVGVIHRAWDTRLRREVALKLLAPELAQNAAVSRRFLDEARITGQLQHPGVVPVHDLGAFADGRPYFAMNLIQGETLEQLLGRRNAPDQDLGHMLSIFGKVCEAIAHAHANGFIHRDLKPSNVMVGPFGIVHVMDWGLAKRLSATDPLEPDLLSTEAPDDPELVLAETQLGAVFGTPAYLAPEQARGEIDRVDRRADVFGLGAMLCEILTGAPPFQAETVREILRLAVNGDVTAARSHLRHCHAASELVDLAYRCLAPDPADRPASAVEVSAILTDYLHSERRRAERNLVRFFELALDLFGIARLDGCFEHVNLNFARVLGYDPGALTERPFLEFVHPDDREETARIFARLCRGSVCTRFLNRYRHASGHYLWLEWNAVLVPDARAIYAAARDVSERVALLESHLVTDADRRRAEAVAESADLAAICTSLDGVIVAWNAGAERLLGYPAAEVIGRSIESLNEVGDPDRLSPWIARPAGRRRVDQFEATLRRSDGTTIRLLVTRCPVRDESGIVLGLSEVLQRLSGGGEALSPTPIGGDAL